MISVETTSEGFTLSVDGRCVLAHSTRRPCFEIGTGREDRRGGPIGDARPEPGRQTHRLKAFRVEESTPEQAGIDFENRLFLSARMLGGRLHLGFSRYSERIEHFRMRIPAVPKESVFGCGERYGSLDLKGCSVPLWVEDRGSWRGVSSLPLAANLRRNLRKKPYATPAPHPSFVSSEKYWVYADVDSWARFDFRNPRFTILEARRIPREVVVGWAGSATETVAGLVGHAGKPSLLPGWTRTGACLGAQGGFSEVLDRLSLVREAGARVASVCVRDWCGRRLTRFGPLPYWSWRADPELYPDFPGTLARLKSDGVRFLGYINPFLAADCELYREARDNGCCVRNQEGRDYVIASGAFPFALLDLTNPRAVRWIKDVLKREMLGPGMSGWLADYGDYLPEDAVLHSGEDPRDVHNRWPALWARANREAIEEAGKAGEAVAILRSGWSGSAERASALWAGAQLSDFDPAVGLASAIPAGISAGMSGAGFWHSDVGGSVSGIFRGRTSECLKRWSELGAFTPLFRTHEGSRPEANRQYWTDADDRRHFARMTEVYAGMGPYHEAVAREFVDAGLPPIRHLWMHYEHEPESRRISYQYLYGRDLLVCPVLRKGITLQDAWLPRDRWIHFWTSRTFRGGSVSLEAPPGYPVVFYREESRFASLFDSIRRNVRKL